MINIKYPLDNNCHIWDGDAYKKYSDVYSYDLDEGLSQKEITKRIQTDESFAKVYGDLGPIYGKQWRDWNGVDQIKNLIDGLKDNPHEYATLSTLGMSVNYD